MTIQPKNHGKRWSPEEDQQLLRGLRIKLSTSRLAVHLGRSETAILGRARYVNSKIYKVGKYGHNVRRRKKAVALLDEIFGKSKK